MIRLCSTTETSTMVFWTNGTVVVTLRNDLIDLLKFKRSTPSTYKRKTDIGIDERLMKEISVADTNNMPVDGLEQALCSFLKSHMYTYKNTFNAAKTLYFYEQSP
ncbi:hypothetical protein G6F43_012840 [Rhizopus delemar]|nr:hypothetical protein G6F43_012840 [Rhizopus delemar]